MKPSAQYRIPLAHINPAYLGYWTVGAIFVGMLLGPFLLQEKPLDTAMKEDHSTHTTHDHMLHHGVFEVTANAGPRLTLSVVKDVVAGWNLHVQTDNFTFAPENVNGPMVANQGHAHIFVDGEKLARLYGPYFHLSDMAPGSHVVKVTLNTNNHETYSVNGKSIAAEALIVQPVLD